MESAALRRKTMQAVKSKNTSIELHIRRLLHAQGYRFRLHKADLPGCPDIVFPARRKAVFVNGCFWHGHDCKRGNRIPATNAEYWRAKIARNRERDRRSIRQLRALGWACFVVWECQLRDESRVFSRLCHFLDSTSTQVRPLR